MRRPVARYEDAEFLNFMLVAGYSLAGAWAALSDEAQS
jgi:hypothetical protein